MTPLSIAIALTSLVAATAMAQFTPWSAPVNVGWPVNGPYMDSCVSISKNGLSLYFASNRHTGDPASSDWDLYVSRRMSPDASWGEPERLPNVNLKGPMDSCPALSLDEHKLYFASDRPGGCGSGDFYVSGRQDRRDDLGWGPPIHLGCTPEGINSPAGEYTPVIFEDERGDEVMYFSSNRAGALGFDLYASTKRHDGTFDPGVPVVEVNSASAEQGFAVRRDGLELIFGSSRAGGGGGGSDLWMATRERTRDPWSTPVPLVYLNGPGADGGKMSFSFDGRQLYFRSNPAGNGDIYVVTRDKLAGR